MNTKDQISLGFPQIEIDQDCNAAYVRLTSEKVARTVSREKGGSMVNVDLDAQGRAVGVELLPFKVK